MWYVGPTIAIDALHNVVRSAQNLLSCPVIVGVKPQEKQNVENHHQKYSTH